MKKKNKVLLYLGMVFLGVSFLSWWTITSQSQEVSTEASYVGSEMCLTCHQDLLQTYERT